MPRPRTIAGPAIGTLLVCLIVSGCASPPRLELTIHDSPRGTVYLERLPDASFQATHPIALGHVTIARALRGMQVLDDRTTLMTLFASQSAGARVFSDDDSDFLAPLIETALAKASPDQRVGFRVNQAASSPSSKPDGVAPDPSKAPASATSQEITSGVLFAYGRSLQVQLTRFRSGIRKASMIDGPNREYASDRTGLTGRKLEFVPMEARRPDTFRVGGSGTPALVIDYELLAKLPDQPAASTGTPAAATSPAQQTAPSAATAEEVETLREELREIKRQLKEQQSRKDSPKQKGKPVPAR